MLLENNNVKVAVYTVFTCRRRGADSEGILLDDGSFLILKGSKIAVGTTPSCSDNTITSRAKLPLKSNILQKDVIMPSPSAASNVVSGANSNGWDEWTDKSGVTLGNYRKERRI